MLDAITNSTYAEMQIFPFEKCFGWPNVQASPVLRHQIGAKTINKHINKPNRLSVYVSIPTVFFFARACVCFQVWFPKHYAFEVRIYLTFFSVLCLHFTLHFQVRFQWL